MVIAAEPGFVYGVAPMVGVIAKTMGVRSQVTADEAEGRKLLEERERTLGNR